MIGWQLTYDESRNTFRLCAGRTLTGPSSKRRRSAARS